jgi:DNA primase
VILCEGYTDTIALHQAGMGNTVGLMGTALTAEQVGELARMARTVLLALDADTSGQEAMLRASSVAAKRKLELRVVELPEGTDPAELVQRDGADAVRALTSRAVPFVRFRVERVLAGGDHSSPEGRDRMLEQLGPVLATLPPSAMRMELTQLISQRLDLPESLVERALAQTAAGPPRPPRRDADGKGGPARQAGATIGRGGRSPQGAAHGTAPALTARGASTERAFLALCIANPGAGAQLLGELDPAEHFTSSLMGRAAEHLRVHLSDPQRDLPADDPELAAAIAQLVVEAGRESERPDMLEVQRLQLQRARMDRQIHQVRAHKGAEVTELARRRGEVMREFDRVYARVLEDTGESES